MQNIGTWTLLHNVRLDAYTIAKQSDWWTYKFCLGKDVEQFHIDPKSPTTPSDKFSLGKHIEEGLDAHVNVKGAEIAYVEKYTGGSTCGLTKRPRTTTIEVHSCARTFKNFRAYKLYSLYAEPAPTCTLYRSTKYPRVPMLS